MLAFILPAKSKKSKGNCKSSISKLEASFVNAQVVQETKSRVPEKLMLDEYFSYFYRTLNTCLTVCTGYTVGTNSQTQTTKRFHTDLYTIK